MNVVLSSAETHENATAVLPLSERSLAFLAYWENACGTSAMPSPQDIRPQEFVSLLPYIRYMRWDGPEKVVYRVWGTALVQWMKIDLTGADVFGLLRKGDRETEKQRLRNLHSHPCGFVQQRQVTDLSGMTRVFEFLTLPVAAGSDGEPRMIGPGSFVDPTPGERVEFAEDPSTVIQSFSYIDLGFGIPT